MPHQCTNCGRDFPDGSKEMLSGCPNCGGNKFQFKPSKSADPPTLDSDDDGTTDTPSASSPSPSPSASSESPSPSASSPSPSPSASTSTSASTAESSSATGSASTSTSASADDPASTPTATGADAADSEDDLIEAECDPTAISDSEDTAQADARRDVVTPDELERANDAEREGPPRSEGRVIEPSSDERPGLDYLREELNDQFESIKILEPGQYELNLMELYDRREYIISLQEDGHYVIEVADSFHGDDE